MPEVPAEIGLSQRHAPGDAVAMTAGVRDFKALFPETKIHIETPYAALWEHNPHVASVSTKLTKPRPIDVTYKRDLTLSPITPGHYISSCHRFLEDRFGVRVPVRAFRGDLHLSAAEKERPAPFDGSPYWLFICGGKCDFTTKIWNPAHMQAVVKALPGVKFVQVGTLSKPHERIQHIHHRIEGAHDLIGRTSLRELMYLVYHCAGVISPVSMLMHMAAAVPTKSGANRLRPCIVTAGGREPAHWEQYPGHQFLQNVGMLSCCATRACFKRRVVELDDGNGKWNNEICEQPVKLPSGEYIAKCQDMIGPDKVIRAVEEYNAFNIPLLASPA